MADFIDHIQQAKHNQRFATALLDTPNYRDWAITAAFYSAIHLAEACFTTDPTIQHTEIGAKREDQNPHDFREEKIKQLAPNAYRDYKKLRLASHHLRYLGMKSDETRDKLRNYYTQEVAIEFITEKLPNLRSELAKAFRVKF